MKKKFFLLPYLISACLVFVGFGVIYNAYGITVPKFNTSSNANSYIKNLISNFQKNATHWNKTLESQIASIDKQIINLQNRKIQLTKDLETRLVTEAKKLSTKTGVVVVPPVTTNPPVTTPIDPNKTVKNTVMCFFENSNTYTCSTSLGTSCTGAGRCELTVSGKAGTSVVFTINDVDKTSITRKLLNDTKYDLFFRSKTQQKDLENKCIDDNTYTELNQCNDDLDCCPGTICRCATKPITSKNFVPMVYGSSGCFEKFRKVCSEFGSFIVSDFVDPIEIINREIKEKITCYFGDTKLQSCKSSKGDYCEGIGSCTVIVSNMLLKQSESILTWTTSCDKQTYPQTRVDGKNEIIDFNCVK